MNQYNLQPKEFVIMQTTAASFGDDGAADLEEVVLTNQNLILCASRTLGLFQHENLIKRCPLERIHDAYGTPCAMVVKRGNTCVLQIPYDSETVVLQFSEQDKRTATLWADAIRNAAAGDFAAIKTEDEIPKEVSNFIDGAKGFVGAVTGAFGIRRSGQETPAAAHPVRPANVTKRCTGCHAPLSGRVGSTVTCAYCDTKQTL